MKGSGAAVALGSESRDSDPFDRDVILSERSESRDLHVVAPSVRCPAASQQSEHSTSKDPHLIMGNDGRDIPMSRTTRFPELAPAHVLRRRASDPERSRPR